MGSPPRVNVMWHAWPLCPASRRRYTRSMSWTRRLLVAASVALAAACAGSTPPPAGKTRLVLLERDLGLRAYVRARLAGEPTMLLVDTGAAQSMLPARLVRERKLRVRSHAGDARLVDSNGMVVRMPASPGVPLQFEREPGAGTVAFSGAVDFLVNPVGEEAILVPQSLLRRGWALVIDLGRGELGYEPEEAALSRVGGNGPPLRKLDFGGCREEGFFERAHRVVPATVNGVPVEMLIDTGAAVTALARNNPALPSMIAAEGQQGAVHGVASVGRGLLVERVPLVFSGSRFELSALVVPVSSGCGHGAIGADVLRHCTIVWGWSELWMSCRRPEERG